MGNPKISTQELIAGVNENPLFRHTKKVKINTQGYAAIVI